MIGERLEGYVYFAEAAPRFLREADAEIAQALGAEIVIAMQHQRLAEEQQRAGAAEARARHLQVRVESLRTALGDRDDFSHIIGRAPAFLDATRAGQESGGDRNDGAADGRERHGEGSRRPGHSPRSPRKTVRSSP